MLSTICYRLWVAFYHRDRDKPRMQTLLDVVLKAFLIEKQRSFNNWPEKKILSFVTVLLWPQHNCWIACYEELGAHWQIDTKSFSLFSCTNRYTFRAEANFSFQLINSSKINFLLKLKNELKFFWSPPLSSFLNI